MKSISLNRYMILVMSFLNSTLGGYSVSDVTFCDIYKQGAITAACMAVDERNAVNRVSPAVVKLIAYDAEGIPLRYGSGFVVAKNGVIISNYHVIQGAQSVTVRMENDDIYPVEGVVDLNVKNDLVVLKIDAQDLEFVKLGQSESLHTDERLLSLGYPGGNELKPSIGYLEERRRGAGMDWLEHSASILPGSSGGPLFNLDSEVVGINAAFQAKGEHHAFAIPVEYLPPHFKK